MLGDVAVVSGTYEMHHKGANGNPVSERGVFTHVFQRGAQWLALRELPANAAARGRSEHEAERRNPTPELPFHIPIFTKN